MPENSVRVCSLDDIYLRLNIGYQIHSSLCQAFSMTSFIVLKLFYGHDAKAYAGVCG